MMTRDVRVFLVDDHALVRESVCRFLEAEPGLEVVGTASDAKEAVQVLGSRDADVVLMDIDMPGLDCFDAADRIRRQHPGIALIFLSAYIHDHYIERALSAGGSGYLTKSESPPQVLQAIRDVARGEMYFSSDVRERLVEEGGRYRVANSLKTRGFKLSPREVEVLRYIARGLSKKDIAALMSLSVKTIEGHTHNIMRKLDLHNRVELTRFAIREGLAEA
ncbi:MAG: response regulator transcription factor [Planctomycetes bacterium]|nr:response regulator transcription factor [Planctomycetota bacterium]